MNFLSTSVKIILLITVVIDFALLVFIFLKRKRGAVYRLLMIHILGILGWTISILIVLQNTSDFAARLTFAFASIFATTKFWFAKIFPENKFPRKIFSYWFLIPTSFAFVISFLSGALFEELKVIDGYYIYVTNGPYSAAYSAIITFFLIYPLFVLFKKYKKGDYDLVIKNQLKYLFAGMALSFVVILLTNSVLPVFFNIYFFNGIGPVFSLALVGFIIYIITRHQFLDIKVAIQRGFIYTVLLAMIVGFYLAVIFILGFFVHETAHMAIMFSAGLTAIVGIFTVPTIDKYLRRITDKIFFKDKYNYAQALRELSEILNKNIELETIIKASSDKLKEIFKTRNIEFVLVQKNIIRSGEKEDQKIREYHDVELSAPINLENEAIGTINIGKKLSGERYTEEDCNLLETFSSQAAVALKKAELYEQAKNYSQELEEKIQRRTEKIKQMQEGQKQMIVDISHELQTPLTIIKGELGFLQKELPNSKELFEFEKSIDKISKFIYDLLNLTKLEANQIVFKNEKINLSDVLKNLLEYFSVLLKDNHIKISSNITPNIFISGDKEKIEQLVTNLVSNAMKYISNDRKIIINLSSSTNLAKLIVKDTGIGIDEESLPYIFDRFYRVKNNNVQKTQGSGLGLAICKQIVEKHNGEIRAESVDGKETKFTITFPKIKQLLNSSVNKNRQTSYHKNQNYHKNNY
jgi:signal transduction histidine kinase